MKMVSMSCLGLVLAMSVLLFCGGCATNGTPSGTQAPVSKEQPSLREEVDREDSGANRPPWENR